MQFAYEWIVLFVRAGGMIALLPGISAQPIPVQVRVAIAGFLAYAATGFVPHAPVIPANLGVMALAMTYELLIGLLLGFSARIIFYAVDFAGSLISTEMGLSNSPQIDPITMRSSTAVGSLISYLAILLFFVSNSHHTVIAAFMRSVQIAPLGIPMLDRNVAEYFVIQTGSIFLVGLQMSAPIMAVNFIVTFTFAVLGKAAPGMSVFSESFSVRILAGLTLLGITLGLTAQIVLSHLRESPEIMLRMLP
jgi:flagellar biosynthesis protein FliR